MARPGLALAVTALALVAAAPASGATFSTITGFPIASGGSAQTHTGKLHPGGPGSASSCASPKSVPAVDPGTFNIGALGASSSINEPACVTVTYSTADATCQAKGLFSTLYLDDFDRSNVQAHYAGDVGSAPTNATPVSYSVVVPGGKDFTVAWNMSEAGAGCTGFDTHLDADRPWAFFKPPVRGHPFVGEPLTAKDTFWAGTPSFAHQWRRCAPDGTACEDISGATDATYTPVPDDVGHTVRVHVAATEGGMTSTADSDPVMVGIQFDAANGQSLTNSDSTLVGWFARRTGASKCGTKQAPPTQVDPFSRFYDGFRHTNEADSSVCTLVSLEQPGTPPAACSVDRTFSAAYLPAVDPASVRSKNYLADGGDSGLVGTLTHRYGFDVPAGAAYDVVVTTYEPNITCPAYDIRFGTASPYPTAAPTVDGTVQAGETLTAGDGGWIGAPTSFAYQWQRCFGDGSGCGDIPGAVGKTLALTDRSVGDSFRVRVTATEGIGSASKVSGPSAAVAEAPPGPPPPPPPPAPEPAAWAGIPVSALTKVVGKKGVVTLTVTCPAAAVIGCVGTDQLRLGKATLGSRSFALLAGKSTTFRFTLSRPIRKRLAKRKTLKGTQVVNAFDMRGISIRTSAKLTLKKKR